MNLTTWEWILGIPTLIIIFLIIICPIFVNQKLTFSIRNKFFRILTILIFSLLISTILTFFLTYYSAEFSNNFLLQKFGFDENGMNEFEYYKNVRPEYIEKLKEIRNSQMGIGWPLKAMFACVFFTLPVNLIVSIIIGMKKIKIKTCL